MQAIVDGVNAELSRFEQIKRFRDPAARLQRGRGRGDADAEAEAPRRARSTSPTRSKSSTRLEAAGADVRRRVPAGEARDLDHVAGVRCVDEAAAADVDPDVAEPVEEDEVAGLRARPARPACRSRTARPRCAAATRRSAEDVHHEAGAVEARPATPRPRRTACRGSCIAIPTTPPYRAGGGAIARRRRRESPSADRARSAARRLLRRELRPAAGAGAAACRALPPAACRCAISPWIEPSSAWRWPSWLWIEARAASRSATICTCWRGRSEAVLPLLHLAAEVRHLARARASPAARRGRLASIRLSMSSRLDDAEQHGERRSPGRSEVYMSTSREESCVCAFLRLFLRDGERVRVRDRSCLIRASLTLARLYASTARSRLESSCWICPRTLCASARLDATVGSANAGTAANAKAANQCDDQLPAPFVSSSGGGLDSSTGALLRGAGTSQARHPNKPVGRPQTALLDPNVPNRPRREPHKLVWYGAASCRGRRARSGPGRSSSEPCWLSQPPSGNGRRGLSLEHPGAGLAALAAERRPGRAGRAASCSSLYALDSKPRPRARAARRAADPDRRGPGRRAAAAAAACASRGTRSRTRSSRSPAGSSSSTSRATPTRSRSCSAPPRSTRRSSNLDSLNRLAAQDRARDRADAAARSRPLTRLTRTLAPHASERSAGARRPGGPQSTLGLEQARRRARRPTSRAWPASGGSTPAAISVASSSRRSRWRRRRAVASVASARRTPHVRARRPAAAR